MLDTTDYFLIQRGGTILKVQSSNLMATLEDSDYLLINRSDTTYKISGADVKLSLNTGNALSPSLPPFGGLAKTETVLNSADGKIEFSLNGSSYSSNLTVPLNDFYYVDWGTDILSASQGSSYSAQITATYPDLGTSNTIDFNIAAIDKLPDPFSFTAMTNVAADAQFESDIISPVESINAPTQIWVTSDAPQFELRVGNGVWFNPPSVPGSAYVSQFEEVQVRHTTGAASNTEYTTTVNIGYGTSAGEFETADFSTTTQAITVVEPILTGDIGSNASPQPSFSGGSYQIVGTAGTHASSDWQIATDSSFSSIVYQSLNDTNNLTSWVPYASINPAAGQTTGRLDGSTTYYIRVRYRSSLGFESTYAEGTLTTVNLVTNFTQGSQQVNRPASDTQYTEFTVPANTGRIKVSVHGHTPSMSLGGGLIVGTFNVSPGEILRVQNVDQTVAVLEEEALSTTSVIAIAGAAGTGVPGGQGAAGGGSSGGNAVNGTATQSSGGQGGTQSSGGGGGSSPGWAEVNIQGGAGGQFIGGSNGYSQSGSSSGSGGRGGAGWFGGGGGGGNPSSGSPGSGGGGGSAKFQTTSSWRQGSQVSNTLGGSTIPGAAVVFEY